MNWVKTSLGPEAVRVIIDLNVLVTRLHLLRD
jgi:hypothetical protein